MARHHYRWLSTNNCKDDLCRSCCAATVTIMLCNGTGSPGVSHLCHSRRREWSGCRWSWARGVRCPPPGWAGSIRSAHGGWSPSAPSGSQLYCLSGIREKKQRIYEWVEWGRRNKSSEMQLWLSSGTCEVNEFTWKCSKANSTLPVPWLDTWVKDTRKRKLGLSGFISGWVILPQNISSL